MPEWEPRDHRARTKTQYRRQMIDRIAIVLGVVFVLSALGGGYAWQKSRAAKLALLAEQAQTENGAGAEALAAIDEAVRAKYEGRKEGALAALARARKINPQTPGLAIAFAELALENQEFEAMRLAAAQEAKHGKRKAQAYTLLGVHRWLTRGVDPESVANATDEALSSFAQAIEEEPFLAPAFFFSGDVLRYAGRQEEGHERTLAALHRFSPWSSADVLTAKVAVASREAGDEYAVSLAFLPKSPLLRALADHLSGSPGKSTLAVALAGQTTQVALEILAAEPVSRGNMGVPEIRRP